MPKQEKRRKKGLEDNEAKKPLMELGKLARETSISGT